MHQIDTIPCEAPLDCQKSIRKESFGFEAMIKLTKLGFLERSGKRTEFLKGETELRIRKHGKIKKQDWGSRKTKKLRE